MLMMQWRFCTNGARCCPWLTRGDNAMSERGVFAIDRGVFDHECFAPEPFTEREAWMWLIAEAAWKPRGRRIGRVVVSLGRGQLAASLRFMAERWQWNKDKVDRFLERLRVCDMIETAAATGITVITIRNYDTYQKVSLPYATAAATTNETATRQQRDKTENIKNIERDDGGGDARPNAFEIATELAKVCGHPSPDLWPPGWCGSPHWVQKCLNEGWLPEIMIAETRAVVGRKRDGPIENFIYLEKPLARAHARHLAPLPKVEITQETINGTRQATDGNAFKQALRRLADDVESDYRGEEIRPPPPRL